MSDIKNKHIAVVCDDSGKCVSLAKVKVVNEMEYNKLSNEYEKLKKQTNENQKKKEEGFLDWSNNVGERLERLEKKDLLLAKSIYDNFVDRGLLNDNDKFQRDFYDFIFNDCELKLENTPNDFQMILRKVGNL